jgi:apolipoprotein N-acyltransferase
LGAPLLLGVDLVHCAVEGVRHYSTSILVDFDGRTRRARLSGRYDKMHPVAFGEYLPFGDWFPWMYDLSPLQGGLVPGKRAESFRIGKDKAVRVAPNICFETCVPHLIRWQVASLTERGEEPDLLVTQSNDGWFWGSAALDMHLVCAVFRAVECRKPLVTAANTGISAWIDADGNVLAQGGRREPAVVVAEPRIDTRRSLYVRYGDWFAATCLAGCAVCAAVGLRARRRAARRAAGAGSQVVAVSSSSLSSGR